MYNDATTRRCVIRDGASADRTGLGRGRGHASDTAAFVLNNRSVGTKGVVGGVRGWVWGSGRGGG